MTKKTFLFGLSAIIISLALPAVSFANKSSVEIVAPQVADKGSNVNIKIKVFHHGNNLLHHTEWVELKINGEPVKKWEYSAFDKPEAADFTLEYEARMNGDLEIEARAGCNVHGSAGPKKATIKAK